MAYYTKEFDVSNLNQLIQELRNIRAAYDNEEEAAFAASMIFTFFGIIGGPAGVCVTASILTGGLGYYFSTVQNTIQKTMDKAEEYKDRLQDNPSQDLVRLKVTTDEKRVDGTTYIIPIDLQVVGIRINGVWAEIN